MRVRSLGFRTDVALQVAEGAEVTDRGDCLVIRTPDNPGFWWGNSLEPEYATVLTCTGIHPPRHVSTGAQVRPLESDQDWRQSVELNLRCYGEEEPTEGAIRVYRDCGFADAQTQVSFARAAA